MSTSVALIVGCALITAAVKSVGPVALGGRELPRWSADVVALLAPALLAALIVTQVLAEDKEIGVGADTAGVLLGGFVMWRFGSVVACVVVAAAVTAGLRAVT